MALNRVTAANRLDRSAAAAIRPARSCTSAWSSGPNRPTSDGAEHDRALRVAAGGGDRHRPAARPCPARQAPSRPPRAPSSPGRPARGSSGRRPRWPVRASCRGCAARHGPGAGRRRASPVGAPISSSGASTSSSSIAHQSASGRHDQAGQGRDPRADVGPGAQHIARPDEQREPSLAALEGLARPPVAVPRERAVERLGALVRQPDRQVARAVVEVPVAGEPEDDRPEGPRPGDHGQHRDRAAGRQPRQWARRAGRVPGDPGREVREEHALARLDGVAQVRLVVERHDGAWLGIGVATHRDDLERGPVVREAADPAGDGAKGDQPAIEDRVANLDGRSRAGQARGHRLERGQRHAVPLRRLVERGTGLEVGLTRGPGGPLAHVRAPQARGEDGDQRPVEQEQPEVEHDIRGEAAVGRAREQDRLGERADDRGGRPAAQAGDPGPEGHGAEVAEVAELPAQDTDDDDLERDRAQRDSDRRQQPGSVLARGPALVALEPSPTGRALRVARAAARVSGGRVHPID